MGGWLCHGGIWWSEWIQQVENVGQFWTNNSVNLMIKLDLINSKLKPENIKAHEMQNGRPCKFKWILEMKWKLQISTRNFTNIYWDLFKSATLKNQIIKIKWNSKNLFLFNLNRILFFSIFIIAICDFANSKFIHKNL